MVKRRSSWQVIRDEAIDLLLREKKPPADAGCAWCNPNRQTTFCLCSYHLAAAISYHRLDPLRKAKP